MIISIKAIREATARGWTSDLNRSKALDSDLIDAISSQIHALFVSDKSPYLGNATTRELILELEARSSLANMLGEQWPNYRTIDRI